MKRPHPLTLAFGLVELALFVWFNSSPRIGSVLYWDHGVTKSHELYGWPYSFLFVLNADHVFSLYPFLLNIAILSLIAASMLYTLNSLLRRTFHIHLATTIVLMSASGLLIYWNLNLYPMSNPDIRTLLIRALLTLWVLSIIALFSEFIFKPEEAQSAEGD